MITLKVDVGMMNWKVTDSIMNDLNMWDGTVALGIDGISFYLVTLCDMEDVEERIKSYCPEAEITIIKNE